MKERPELTANQTWIKEHFEAHSLIRSADEFAEKTVHRQFEIEDKLPEDALRLRKDIRQALGIGDDVIWVALGEQPCGLNEPPLVLGKRLLGAYMAGHYNWKVLEYFASSDVVGSEGGMYRVEVPYPQKPHGIHTINFVSGTKLNQTPATRALAREVDVEKVTREMVMVYGEHYPRVHQLIGQMFLEFAPGLAKENSLAHAQNRLLGRLEHHLGLRPRKNTIDVDFDTKLAQVGGLDLILKNWGEIVETANKYKNPTTRIPYAKEAPFYAYPEDLTIRPRVWIKDRTLKNYEATHPDDNNRVLMEFTYEDIIEGKIGITFRAIPRIILMSTVFDACITGGGAKYNEVAKPTYEEIFEAPYFPLAWMDLTNELGKEEGIFQYLSLALRKGGRGVGYQKAEELVRQGKVGMLDLALSLRGNERIAIQQVLGQESLSMSQRVDFTRDL